MPIDTVSGGQPITSSWGNSVANAINAIEYRAGSWTPVLTFATPGLAVAYSVQTGLWTRVGNMVFFMANINTSTWTLGTAAGGLRMTGFPFTSAVDQAAFVSMQGWSLTNYGDVALILRAGQTYCEFQAEGSGQPIFNLTPAQTPGPIILRAAGFYRTNAA